ncbi:MAG TPA: hypothetical protein VFZ40_09505 [Pyrinomonadaceae bacterium]
MKTLKIIAVLLFACITAYSQEVPKGVRYKKASDAVNNAAKTNLETALASDSLPTDFFGDVTVAGPMLWKSLKPSADQLLLKAMPVTLIVPGPQSFSAEGKRIRTDDERKAFWTLLRSKYPNLKDGKVRKGNAQEISYYWATIPFDIEEPFWVIEAGADRFIAHFSMTSGQPRLFWIDRVGDLQTLKP